MPNIQLQSLVIETTRECNMCCAHCLRGEQQDLTMPNDILEKTFRDITYLSELTFSGGEPSLAPEVLTKTLDICKREDICVESFYVATNGKHVSKNPEFLHALTDWSVFTKPNDIEGISGIALSRDPWHEEISDKDLAALQTFACFRNHDKNLMEHENNLYRYPYLINEGRALNLTSVYPVRNSESYIERLSEGDAGFINVTYDKTSKKIETFISDQPIYIAANGNVSIGCNDSYNDPKNVIGNLYTQSLWTILQKFAILKEYYDNDIDQLSIIYESLVKKANPRTDLYLYFTMAGNLAAINVDRHANMVYGHWIEDGNFLSRPKQVFALNIDDNPDLVENPWFIAHLIYIIEQ